MTLKFDFQQNEVSFFFFLSHLSALSCIYGADAEHSSALYVLSTLLSILTMPLMIGLYELLL